MKYSDTSNTIPANDQRIYEQLNSELYRRLLEVYPGGDGYSWARKMTDFLRNYGYRDVNNYFSKDFYLKFPNNENSYLCNYAFSKFFSLYEVSNYLTDYFERILEDPNVFMNKILYAYVDVEPSDLLFYGDCYFERMFIIAQTIGNFVAEVQAPQFTAIDNVVQALMRHDPIKWRPGDFDGCSYILKDFAFNECPLYIYDRFCYDKLFYKARNSKF